MAIRIRTLVTGLAVVLTLASCNSMNPAGGAGMQVDTYKKCSDGLPCVVDVDLDANPNCGNKCMPQVAFLVEDLRGEADIVWRIAPNTQAIFPPHGIHFVKAESRFDCEPPRGGPSSDKRSFTCHNPHVKNADGWKYAIKIVPAIGAPQEWDPWVVNK